MSKETTAEIVRKWNEPFEAWWRHQGLGLFDGKHDKADLRGAYGAGYTAGRADVARLETELGEAREALQDLDTLLDFSEPVVPLGQMPRDTKLIDAAFTKAHRFLNPDCAHACCTIAPQPPGAKEQEASEILSQDDMDRELHGS